MGRYAGRFVVDTHAHAQRAVIGFKERGIKAPSIKDMYTEVSTVQWVDNSERLLYDMERYGIDMCVLQSGGLARGMDNDLDVQIAERHPGKFAVLCYPTTILNKASRGEAKWTIEGALKETEERLKTGKYKGIGQGLPVTETGPYAQLWATGEQKKKVESLPEGELLDRYRMFYELARKYKVAIAGPPHEEKILDQLLAEYPDVPNIMQLVGWGRSARKGYIEDMCELAGRYKNFFLEMGCAPAELYEVALSDPNVGPTQIIFGTDWGASHHIYSQPCRPIRGEPFTSYVDWIRKWGAARYQTDFWGWALHQIDKLRDTLTQDELNLILGGNAARIFKLDVPFTRLFVEGRVDLWGMEWEKYVPFIPHDQVKKKFKGK
jgi:predicted TIM-barrel fold metal-dependent hydrolase